jgi:hypothetical protein
MGDTSGAAVQRRATADFSRVCAVCGREIASCAIPGLHGMVRERAARAAEELRRGKGN